MKELINKAKEIINTLTETAVEEIILKGYYLDIRGRINLCEADGLTEEWVNAVIEEGKELDEDERMALTPDGIAKTYYENEIEYRIDDIAEETYYEYEKKTA